MLAEFRRVLAPDGVLVISSPNRPVYNEGGAAQPLPRARARPRRARRRCSRRAFRSRRGTRSACSRIRRSGRKASRRSRRRSSRSPATHPRRREPAPPMYFLVVCAAQGVALPALPALSLFDDGALSLWRDYARALKRERAARLGRARRAQGRRGAAGGARRGDQRPGERAPRPPAHAGRARRRARGRARRHAVARAGSAIDAGTWQASASDVRGPARAHCRARTRERQRQRSARDAHAARLPRERARLAALSAGGHAPARGRADDADRRHHRPRSRARPSRCGAASRACCRRTCARRTSSSWSTTANVDAEVRRSCATSRRHARACSVVDAAGAAGLTPRRSTAPSTLHRDRDVVVLHSDAEVANDWLDRLAAPREARGDVGVVAALHQQPSASAAYPLPRSENPLPDGHTVASLDALFARANARPRGRAAVALRALPVLPPRVPARRRRLRRRAARQRLRRRDRLLPARRQRGLPPSPRRRRVRRATQGHAIVRPARRRASSPSARRPRWPSSTPRSRRERKRHGRARARPPLRAPGRPAAARRVGQAAARVRVASVGRRHPPLHERPRGAHRRPLRGALPRARRRRHGEALLAAAGRELRALLHAAGRAADARRDAAHAGRRAAALPPRAPAAAGDPRPARSLPACRTTTRCTTTTRSARSTIS